MAEQTVSTLFSLPVQKYEELLLSLGCGCGHHHTLYIYNKVFYVIVKVLSGKLSCTHAGLLVIPATIFRKVKDQKNSCAFLRGGVFGYLENLKEA